MDIRTEFLFEMTLSVSPTPQAIGATPQGQRRVFLVEGGAFNGPKLQGAVLPGGSDWILVRPDDVTELDVRLTMRTDDGHILGLRYRGFRHGPKNIMDRLARGEEVDPGSYYFRTTPVFDVAAGPYAWLNRIVCVGIGHRRPTGPVYHIHRVL